MFVNSRRLRSCGREEWRMIYATDGVHRAPAGRHLRRPAPGGPPRRGVRLRRVLPVRPLPGHGPATARPGPTDAWVTLAGLARETSRIRLGTMVTVGHVPAARPAGDHGRPGRRDERRPGRAGPRAPAGSRPSTRRTASRSRPSASASTGWPSSSRSSPGSGRRRRASVLVTRASTTRSRTRRRCPSRCSARARR